MNMLFPRQRWNFSSFRLTLILLFFLGCSLEVVLSATTFLDATACRGGGSSAALLDDDHKKFQRAVVNDVTSSLQSKDDTTIEPLSYPSNVKEASQEFAPNDNNKGTMAWKFLTGLASSRTFRNEYWHKRPLLVRANDTGGWIQGSFTVDHDLRHVIDGSYITGHKTAEILRNGTKTDTWVMRPLKDNPARKTTWHEVEEALQGGTIYFNTAGSLWPTLGALCRLTIAAFGIPANVNVYVTPPGITTSVPPHTDRQDVLVLQTQGSKRWRVFAPPARVQGVDPLNRGKNGNVLSFDELDEPLIDTVIQQGDVLYVPTGFPHTTDTSSTTIGGDDGGGGRRESCPPPLDETSVHLTMGLDTHVWALTFAHMRWSLMQRLGLDFRLNIDSDDVYWESMETIPIGFLGGEQWRRCVQRLQEGKEGRLDETLRKDVIERFKSVLEILEPDRWQNEELPSNEDIGQVVDYMIGTHLQEIFEIQELMFSGINPHDEQSLVKAFECTQRQNSLMENFAAFSKNEAMQSSFEQRRLQQDEKLRRSVE